MSRETSSFGQFRPAPRRTVQLSTEELVRTRYLEPLDPDRRFPLVFEPGLESVNLISWAGANRELVERELSRHGAILFRGFNLAAVEDFGRFVESSCGGSLDYSERSSPRSQVSGRIYTSTDYPPSLPIFLHNEQSYNRTFMLRILFFCVTPAQEGGATPIADVRKVYQRIEPRIRRRFSLFLAAGGRPDARQHARRPLPRSLLVAAQGGGRHGRALPVGERRARGARSRRGAEPMSARFGEFKPSQRKVVRVSGEDLVRFGFVHHGETGETGETGEPVRPATVTHPQTGETLWFNHAHMFHDSNLPAEVRRALLEQFREDELPRNSFYGDGTPIESSILIPGFEMAAEQEADTSRPRLRMQ